MKTWKAFIQLDSIQQAKVAKNKLNQTNMNGDGTTMRIYYSDL